MKYTEHCTTVFSLQMFVLRKLCFVVHDNVWLGNKQFDYFSLFSTDTILSVHSKATVANNRRAHVLNPLKIGCLRKTISLEPPKKYDLKEIEFNYVDVFFIGKILIF